MNAATFKKLARKKMYIESYRRFLGCPAPKEPDDPLIRGFEERVKLFPKSKGKK